MNPSIPPEEEEEEEEEEEIHHSASRSMVAAAATLEVQILSKSMIRPSPLTDEQNDRGYPRVIDLTPWDLKYISIEYIQQGLLFREPQPQGKDGVRQEIISSLRSSFSRALDHFFPLAGRFAIVKHDSSPTSIFIVLECNNRGAEFIHASAPDVTVSEILDSVYIPSVVLSFFPLDGVVCYDGHSLPLLAVQITELADGIFVACSMNHAVADGTSFWHFFNTWSGICRTGDTHIADPPVFDRFFVNSCPAPIRLPFSSEVEFIRRFPPCQITNCIFNFSAESVAKLKAKANDEMGTDRISSLQSLLGHVWRSVTRARGLNAMQETTHAFAVGCRARMNPPLPQAYFGNSLYSVMAKAKAGELLERGLGWSAWLLNQAVASYRERAARDMLEQWPKSPSFLYVELKPWEQITGSSPRFDVYGNDFGWGKPVAVRRGRGSKRDGVAFIYQGPEKGSMGLEVTLPPKVLSALLEDVDFIEVVSNYS